MKIVLTIALLASAPAFATDVTPEIQQHCAIVGDIARAAMTARQANVAMSDLMTWQEKRNQPTAPDDVRLVNTTIIEAYNWRRADTPEAKSEAVNDFANNAMRDCFNEATNNDRGD